MVDIINVIVQGQYICHCADRTPPNDAIFHYIWVSLDLFFWFFGLVWVRIVEKMSLLAHLYCI